MSDDRAELLAGIRAKAVIRGDFVLSSGRRADVYVDLRRVLLDGRLAPLAGRVMLDLTADLGYDAVGGLTLGADPVATAMMHAAAARGTPVDAFVVRKKDKEHGTQRRIEGPDVAGRRVLAVEDTSTTGDSVLTAVDKFYGEACLLEQPYIRNDKQTVSEYLAASGKESGCAYTVTRFTRYKLGEGIEKKNDDFAAEVASFMK